MCYEEATYYGVSLSQLSGPAVPANPNTNMPGDREFVELMRSRMFADARQRFPDLYTNHHLGFLSQLTGQPAPVDDQGPIPLLSEVEFLAAIAYLEGPTKL